jgi:hypothetical protein
MRIELDTIVCTLDLPDGGAVVIERNTVVQVARNGFALERTEYDRDTGLVDGVRVIARGSRKSMLRKALQAVGWGGELT